MKQILILLILLMMLRVSSASTSFSAKIVNGGQDNQRILRLLKEAEKIVNSEDFKKRILSSTFTSTKDTSEQIYQKILCAHENFNDNGCNKVYEIQWELARNKKYVLGWTYPKYQKVYFNSRNFRGRTDRGIVGTILHEAMHKIGYDHKSASDHQSVPYSVGTIASELMK